MGNSRRICLVVPFLPDSDGLWGGVRTHIDQLIRLLLKTGWRVTIIAPGGAAPKKPAGCDVFLMKTGLDKFLKPEWFSALRETFASSLSVGRPDRIISEAYYALGLEEAAAGIPVTAFVHNFHLIHFHKFFSEADGFRSKAGFCLKEAPRLGLQLLRYELPFLLRADSVVSVSEHNADLLRRYYRLPADKVRVIHNWVDTEAIYPSAERRSAARRELGIPEDRFIFLCVGSLWRPKGFQVAIEAFGRVMNDLPPASLLIGGEGPYRNTLETMAKRTAGGEAIRFLGQVTRQNIPGLFAAADAFLMPSVYPEALAYTLLEAMAAGLPAVSTKIGGNPETAGESGILVSPGNAPELAEAMRTLARDMGLRKRLGETARARALELFSGKTAEKKLEKLLA